MIKATGRNKDGSQRFVILGLSEANLSKLREGKPIHIFGAELGIPHDIIVFWGQTEEAMARELEKAYGSVGEKVRKQ